MARTDKKQTVHPPVALMVHTSVKNMKERGGSSLKAVKKYMASIYKVDSEKLATLIKKAIRNGIASGTLIQTKGNGLSGSFKIAKKTTTVNLKPATKPKSLGKVIKSKPAANKMTPKTKSPGKVIKSKPTAKMIVKPKSLGKIKSRPTAKMTAKPKSPGKVIKSEPTANKISAKPKSLELRSTAKMTAKPKSPGKIKSEPTANKISAKPKSLGKAINLRSTAKMTVKLKSPGKVIKSEPTAKITTKAKPKSRKRY